MTFLGLGILLLGGYTISHPLSVKLNAVPFTGLVDLAVSLAIFGGVSVNK